MAEQIRCSHCGQTWDVTSDVARQYAGQTITCTNCNRAFTVPATVGTGFPGNEAPAPGTPPVTPGAFGAPATGATAQAPRRGVPPAYPAPADATYASPPAPPMAVPYASPMPAAQSTSALAVTSLVCGCIGLLIPIIPGLIAIVLGILAIRKTRDPRVGGRGLAIAGLSVGAASIVLSGCTMSILLPSLNRARETANRVKCASNMRQIGQAILLYSNANRGKLPARLEDLLLTQPIDGNIFICPSTSDSVAPGTPGPGQAPMLSAGGHLSYVYVGQNLSINAPMDAVMLYEPPSNHSGDGMNVLFINGHVEFFSKAAANNIIQNLQAGKNPPFGPNGP